MNERRFSLNQMAKRAREEELQTAEPIDWDAMQASAVAAFGDATFVLRAYSKNTPYVAVTDQTSDEVVVVVHNQFGGGAFPTASVRVDSEGRVVNVCLVYGSGQATMYPKEICVATCAAMSLQHSVRRGGGTHTVILKQ
jgi:hypothetical protein